MLPDALGPLEEIARKLDEYNKRLSHLERLEAAVGALTLIEDKHLTGPVATLDFQNIPATFKHLELITSLRVSGAVAGTFARMTFNNDGGNNYDYFRAGLRSGADVEAEALAVAFIQAVAVTGSVSVANVFGMTKVQIPDYADSTIEKGMMAIGQLKQINVTRNLFIILFSGWWRSSAAINRIIITSPSGNFIVNSRATLYGLN